MAEIPQKHDFPTLSIQNFVGKGKQFVIDLANKLRNVEKFLISFYVMCY